MVERKRFFVTIDTEDIRETSVPDGIEFEIIATQNEVKEIRELFDKKDKNSKDALKYLAKPFDEWGADDERRNYDAHLLAIFQRIYEFGTQETKEGIDQMGIFN